MKADKTANRTILLTGLTLHAAAGNAQAGVSVRVTSHKEVDVAIGTGDFSGYLSGSSEWLSQKAPADTAETLLTFKTQKCLTVKLVKRGSNPPAMEETIGA